KGTAPVRINDAPHSIKFDLPPAHPAVTAQSKTVVPPVPPGSKPVLRSEPGKGPGKGNLGLSSPATSGLPTNAATINPGLSSGTPGAGLKPFSQTGVPATTTVVPGPGGRGPVPPLAGP